MEETSQGQGHQVFAKLVWLFFFIWLMKMTTCKVACEPGRWPPFQLLCYLRGAPGKVASCLLIFLGFIVQERPLSEPVC